MGIEISPARQAEKSINQRNMETDVKQTGVQISLVPNNNVQEEQQQSYSEGQVINAIEHANNAFRMVSTRFEFSIHEDTKEIMVKVIDEKTQEVIREIPPEKILDMVAKMWELAGILVDEKV